MSLGNSNSPQIFSCVLKWTAALFACGSLSVAGEPAVIRVAGSAWVGDAPTSLANQHDWFNAGRRSHEPLVRVDYAKSGQDALALLLDGQAEFALAADTPVARAILDATLAAVEDAPVLLAVTALSTGTHHLIVDGEKGIAVPKDLAGRRLGVMFGTSGHYAWSRFCRIHDICDAGVQLVNTPVKDMAPLLETGELDAAVMWDPWSMRLRMPSDSQFHALSMRMVYSINWILVSRQSVLEEYPGVAERILAAYLRATGAMADAPAEAIALHASKTEIPVSYQQVPGSLAWHLSLDWSLVTSLEIHMRWIADELGQDGPLPQLFQYIRTEPLRRVAPERVRLPRQLSCHDDAEECLP